MSELLGLASREWYVEENFLFQKLIFINFDWSNMREIVWNSTMRMTVSEWHAHSVLKLTEKKNSNLTHNCDKANQLEQDKQRD